MRLDARQRDRARGMAKSQISLKGKACEACGATGALHRHHPDYSKPLEVKILCPACHTKEHAKGRVGPRNARLADAYESMRNGLIDRAALRALAEAEGVCVDYLNGIWRRARGFVGQGTYYPRKRKKREAA